VSCDGLGPDFYGTPMRMVAQEAMRGPSAWSVGDRELMGAFVSKMNNCEVCTKTHAGVAALAYEDEGKVSAALSDLETAAVEGPLRATLRMLRKLTREHAVDADDMRASQSLRGRREVSARARLPLTKGLQNSAHEYERRERLATNPQRPCGDWATHQLPAARRAQARVGVGGAAGVRVDRSSSSTAQTPRQTSASWHTLGTQDVKAATSIGGRFS
jgi:hypothetical protein